MSHPSDNPLENIQRARSEERYADVAELIPEEARGNVFHEVWFPTIISMMDIKNYKEQNKIWLTEIFKWRDEDQSGVQRSNDKGWHSAVDMHTRPQFIPMGQQFLRQAAVVAKRMGFDESAEPIIVNMWANVSPYGAANKNHNHANCILSLAYYLQAPPGCGKICFFDPRAQATVLTPPFAADQPRPREMLNEVVYEPIPGRCVMFPSWLMHEVQPNHTAVQGDDGLRVSVSANIFFRMKKDKVAKDADNKGMLTVDGEILEVGGMISL
ncbi:MAG: TIGR02466 family protein [Gammaproteobacteria bacterium]|jgi:uncharacterized protein (TIGR02466 family)